MLDSSARLKAALTDRYEIHRELGQGGMATVYLAQDLKHDRRVALKVLKPELAAVLGAERFVQEIKTTASLQHPHILPLFDSGEAGGFLYYVMPYIEGETLRDKLNRETQLGIEEAVRITTEVADALDYAHRHGVIHRDIKPENILLHDGRPVVADFGIALAVSAAAGGRMTETGLSLGTPHYMSPEQATADRQITARSDIYSLGAVLYEMLTGDPPHTGSSAQAIIMKIVTDEARPVTELRKSVPPHVAAAALTALEKLPADRFASAAEFAEALAGRGPRAAARAPGVTRPSRPRAVDAALVALALALGVGVGWSANLLLGGNRGSPRVAPRTLDLVLPDSLPLLFLGSAPLGVEQRALDLSPDGRQLVFVSATPSGTMLVVQDLVRGRARVLEGTEGAFSPSFSPDGGSVAYFTGTKLAKVPATGGTPQVLASVDEPWGSVWLDSSRIFVAGRQGGDPMLIDAFAGRVDSIPGGPARAGGVTPDRTGMVYSFQHALRYYDFTTRSEWVLTSHGRVPADSIIPPDAILGFGPALLPSNRLLYVQQGGGGTLLAVQMERETLRPMGSPVQVSADVRFNIQGNAQFAASADGGVVTATTAGSGRTALVARSRSGGIDSLGLPAADYGTFEISPDGGRIALTVWPVNGLPEIWVYDVARATSEPVAQGTLRRPLWVLDDAGAAVLDTSATAASLDGRFALREVPEEDFRFVGPETPPGGVRIGTNGLARFSADGAWLAVTSLVAGRSEVYVLSTAAPTVRYRVSVSGGEEPRWSRDGRRIVFRYGTQWFESAFTPGSPPSIGLPEELFEGAFENVPGYSYDIFPDGRYLLLQPPAERTTHRLTFITDLPGLLEDEAARRP